MVSEEIIFAPDIDERMLNKEVGKVNDSLQDAGQIDPEIGDVQGDLGLGELAGGGRERGGMGGAFGGAALASRIPKPIAGVTASAAMPVALAGGVGLGLLSAMHGASARLQTSTSLLGQAWNNVWRPIGDKVDQLFVRDTVKDMVDATQSFEETFRNDNPVLAVENLLQDFLAADSPGGRGSAANTLRKWLTGGPSFTNVVANYLETKANNFDWSGVSNLIAERWDQWDNIVTAITAGLPGVPDDLGPASSSPNVGVPDDLWPASSDILREFPELSLSSLRERILGGDDGSSEERPGRGNDPRAGGGDTGGLDTDPTTGGVGGAGPQDPGGGGGSDPPRDARTDPGGGRATPRDVEGPRDARTSPGGGRATPPDVDTSAIEEKLDRVERAIRDMDGQQILVDGEQFGRLTTETRNDSVFDTDPTV